MTSMHSFGIAAQSLGSAQFRADYGLAYAYLAGAMFKGISSAALVVAMGQRGMLGYLGTGGLSLADIERDLVRIRGELGAERPSGMNLLCNLVQPELEDRTVALFLKHDVRFVEAAAFMRITPSLVRWRLKTLEASPAAPRYWLLAKVSRPEVATAFMRPAPEDLVRELVAAGEITHATARRSETLPMADDICVEADSGGHTDQGSAYALMPAMLALRDEMMERHRYARRIRVGAAGGIGTPHAAAAAFILGADFILTGSINQCTVEAGTSDAVKDLLQTLQVQDTAYAPAGDMFEIGARVQVAKRGLLFPSRANRLYELYLRHDALAELDAKTRAQLEDKYFRRSFDDVWSETSAYYLKAKPDVVAAAEADPKRKMALIFKWYFVQATRAAMQGDETRKVDYQVHCGPAMGAFNAWVKGTPLASWRNRRVAELGERIMTGAAQLLSERLAAMLPEGRRLA